MTDAIIADKTFNGDNKPLSLGYIRLAEPAKLANYLFAQPGWKGNKNEPYQASINRKVGIAKNAIVCMNYPLCGMGRQLGSTKF